MPTWLFPILLNVGKSIWHAICRFWSVFLIAAILFAIYTKYTGFKFKQYEIGYKAGYSQAIHDHPPITVQNGGVANVNPDPHGLIINIWKLHLGGWWR